MSPLIELKDVTKHYKSRLVLDQISFSISPNKIIALVGKNGSGKSTLLRILGGLMRPDSGMVYTHRESLKIGYVPEVTPAFIPFTPEEYLLHMGTISGLSNQELRSRIDYLLSTFQLEDARHARITAFSKGMKQKIMIMQAMLKETNLLILDEPLSGLDPRAQKEVEDALLRLKEQGVSIVLTCHEVKLLENAVDEVLLLKNHQVIQTAFLHKTVNEKNLLIFEMSKQPLTEKLLAFLTIQQKIHMYADIYRLEAIVHEEHTDHILKELLRSGASIKQLAPLDGTQEAFYQQFFQKGD